MSLPLVPGNAVRTKATRAVCDEMHDFFHTPRKHTHCKSSRPSKDEVRRHGDFAQSWWMRSFFDGTIDLSLQTDGEGCILLQHEDAERVREFHNPLRDPLVVVQREGHISLKDGFHRLCEALARGYRGRVWTVVLDMDAEDESTDDTDEFD